MIDDEKNVCVAVPIYKDSINEFEEISLIQVLRVMNKYRIYFFAPKKLVNPKYLIDKKALGCNFEIIYFDDYYFESTTRYSELLLDTRFYDRFIDYKYILVYQLDAFIFFDKLHSFMDDEYDYIGAPWEWECYKDFPVGNGGLSLRNVRRCRDLVSKKDSIIENNPYKEYFSVGEDVFFSYCGSNKSIDFRTPDPYVASTFAVQDNSFDGIQDIIFRGLPLGIHHFPKWNYYFWKPLIETYGYRYPEVHYGEIIDNLEDRFQNKYEKYIMKELSIDKYVKGEALRTLDLGDNISIWGMGREGVRILRILDSLGIKVAHVYDRRSNTNGFNRTTEEPQTESIKKRGKNGEVIIVSTSKYEMEIVDELDKIGLKIGDYISYTDFINKWKKTINSLITRFPSIRGVTERITFDNTFPKVSIIIPCYNVGPYLQDCLKSLLYQTYRNLEIFCVDDGSTDDTVQIVNNIQKNDTRVNLIKQSNQYAGVARNNGLKFATGKYILFFDGDDYCDTNMLTEMVASAEKHDSDIVVCDVRNLDNRTGIIDDTVPYLNRTVLATFEREGVVSFKDIPDHILLLASSGPWNKLYRRDFIEKHKLQFQDSKRDNDEFFVLMSMALAEKISWISRKFVTYRINNPLSLQGFAEDNIDINDMLSTIRELKRGLVRTGKYDLLRNSMKNQILIRYSGLIEGQRSWKNFKEVFNITKNVVFPEFEIDVMKESDVLVCLKERRMILSHNAEEYLFWLIQRLKMSDGERFSFPFEHVNWGERIGLYGAGRVGKAYYKQICNSSKVTLVGWYDIDADKYQDEGLKVLSPNTISAGNLDKVIIAIESFKVAMRIKEFLLEKGLSEHNIVWQV